MQIDIIIKGDDQSKDAFKSASESADKLSLALIQINQSNVSQTFTQVAHSLTEVHSGASAAAIVLGETLVGAFEKVAEVGAEAIKKAVEGIWELGKGAIEVSSKFELYQASLESVYSRTESLSKASSDASESMANLVKYATDKPFTVAGLTEAYQQLQAYGLEATNVGERFHRTGEEILTAMGNAKSANPDIQSSIAQLSTWFGQAAEGSTSALHMFMKNTKITKDEMEEAGVKFKDGTYKVVSDQDAAMTALLGIIEKNDGNAMSLHMKTLDGMKSNLVDFRDFFEKTAGGPVFERVKDMLSHVLDGLWSPESQQAIKNMGTGLGEIFDAVGKMFGGVGSYTSAIPGFLNAIANTIVFVGDVANLVADNVGNLWQNFFLPLVQLVKDAYVYGQNIAIQFANGISVATSFVGDALNTIGGMIIDFLQPHSPPKIVPDLDKYGTQAGQLYLDSYGKADATTLNTVGNSVKQVFGDLSNAAEVKKLGADGIQNYLTGWSTADFSGFNAIATQIQSTIDGLVNGGKLPKEGAIPMILGTRESVAAAIEQMVQTGNVSQDALDRITKSAGPAGAQIVELTKAQIDLMKATKETADAQKLITDLNDQYKQAVEPLNDRLRAITDQQRALKEETRQATEGDRARLQTLSDQYEAYQKMAAIRLDPLKTQLDSVKDALTALTEQTAKTEAPFRAQLQTLSDQYEAYQKLAQQNLQPLRDQLDGVKASQQALTDQTAAAIGPLNQQATALQNQYAAYQQMATANLAPLRGELDSVKAAQQDLADTLASQVDPMKGQIDFINGQMQEIANAQKLQDLNDQIHQTGKHKNDLAHAQLAVALDETHQKEAEIQYAENIRKLHEEIATKKAAGKDTTDLEVKLQETQLKHQDDLLRSQEKLAADKDKLADVTAGPKGGAVKHAELEKEKIVLEEQVKHKVDAAKVEQDHLREKAHGIEEQIKVQETADKAHLDGIKAQENGVREHIKAIQEASAAESLALKEKEQGLVATIKTQENADKAKLQGIKDQEDAVKDQIRAIDTAAKAQIDALTTTKKALEDQIKDQEKADKAKLDGIKAEQDAVKDTIKQKEDAAKAQAAVLESEATKIHATLDQMKVDHEKNLEVLDKQLESAKQHKATATEHLKVLQDQNKVMDDNMKLVEKQDKLVESMSKTMAGMGAHHTAGVGAIHSAGVGPGAKHEPVHQTTFGGDKGTGHRTHEDDSMQGLDQFQKMHGMFDSFKTSLDGFKNSMEGVHTSITNVTDKLVYLGAPIIVAQQGIAALNPALGFLKQQWETLNPYLQSAGTLIGQVADGIMGGVWGALKALQPSLDMFSDAWKKFTDDIIPKLQPMWDALTHAFKDFAPILGLALIPVLLVLTTTFSAVIGVIGGLFTAVSFAMPGIMVAIDGAITYVTGILKLFGDVFDGLGNLIRDVVKGKWQQAWEDLKTMGTNVFNDLGMIITGFFTMFIGVVMAQLGFIIGFFAGFVSTIIGFFTGLYDTLVGHSIIPDMVNEIVKWFNQMVTWVTTTVSGWITSFTTAVTGLYNDVFNTITVLTNVVSTLFGTMVTNVTTTIVGFTVAALITFNQWTTDVTTAATNLGNNVFNAISGAFTTIKIETDNFVNIVTGKITDAATGVLKAAESVGTAMVNGIKSGLENAWGGLTAKLAELASSLPKPIKDVLDIKSPSKVFDVEVGQMIPAGIAQGIDTASGLAQNSARGMGQSLLPATQTGTQTPITTQQTTNTGHTFTFQNCVFNGTTQGAVQQAVLSGVTDALYGKV